MNDTLTKYQLALEGAIGAITAHTLVQSRESSRVIRECSKELDKLSTQLRKDLLAAEKLMVINHDSEN